MRVSVAVIRFDWPEGPAGIGPRLGRIVRGLEEAGVHGIWVQDHFLQNPIIGPPEEPVPEAYTTLGFVAAHTRRAMLGTLVTGVTYRHPGVLVKQVSTLDALSGGRACLGIGAAWYQEEHEAFGIPFPPLRERFERLEETLVVAHRMADGDERAIHGRHYALARPVNSPAAVQRPRPPILVGGAGEARTLRLVAKYADACNLFEKLGPDELRRKLAVLAAHCEREGRDPAEIEKTTFGLLALSRQPGEGTQTPEQAVARLADLAAMGFDHAIVAMPDPADPAAVELLAEVVTEAAALPSRPAASPAAV